MKLPPAKRTLSIALCSINLLLFAPAQKAQASTILYDFNTAGSLAIDFNRLNDPNNYWNHQTTGGLSGTGSLLIASSGTNTSTSAVVATEGIDAEVASFTLSVFFEARTAASTGFQFMIGVVPTESTAPSVASGQAGTQLAVGLNLGSTGYRWAEYNNASIAGKNAVPGNVFSLTDGNWYYFEATFERSGTIWDISYSIHSANTDGTLPSESLISATSATFTNAALSASDEFYPFLAVANNPAGRVVNRFDNFAVTPIPEPQTLASMAFGLLLLGAHGIRKRIARSRSAC